jgi:hypothetical protein
MNASFRYGESTRNSSPILLVLPSVLALSTAGFCFSLIDLKSPAPITAACMFGAFPFFMFCVGVFGALSISQHMLTIQDDRLTVRGLLGTKDIDLKEVTRARWIPRWGVSLQSGKVRLVILLRGYERPEQEAIIHHLRSVIDPAVQIDWNLFAYKRALRVLKPQRTKAGPDEVLVHRSYWDRRLLLLGLPLIVAGGMISVVAWRMTGESRYLATVIGTVHLLLWGWLIVRYQVPVQGRIDRKVSSVVRSEPTIRLLLLWTLCFLLALVPIAILSRHLAHPDLLMAGAALVWCVGFIFEMVKKENNDKQLDRELADLAAKDHGEPRADPWHGEVI